MFFFRSPKHVEVARGKVWAVRRMLVFLSQISLTRLAVWGRALSCKRMIPSGSIPGRFEFMARRSTLSHEETNHTSLLFFACLHFQCWTNSLYTTVTSRAIKKKLCGLVRFHYACLLPYRWQYRYVTTVFPAFDRSVFYGGCSVFIWPPPHPLDRLYCKPWVHQSVFYNDTYKFTLTIKYQFLTQFHRRDSICQILY